MDFQVDPWSSPASETNRPLQDLQNTVRVDPGLNLVIPEIKKYNIEIFIQETISVQGLSGLTVIFEGFHYRNYKIFISPCMHEYFTYIKNHSLPWKTL